MTRTRSGETVRALNAAVKAAAGTEPEPDEAWERVSVPVSPEARPFVDKALELAGKILGATAPKWQRIQAICEEYLGAQGQPDEGEGAGVLHGPVEDGLEPLMELLEQETAQWALLERPNPVLAPVAGAAVETDSSLLDAELRRLAGLRARWDDVFGHLAMLMQTLGLWRDAGFASFGHYCSERLRMSERTVGQRIALERRLRVLPLLRQAMREGRISYEKARLVAWQADDTTVEEIIGVAEAMTCIDLRRKIEAEEEEQMCARGDFDFRAPRASGRCSRRRFPLRGKPPASGFHRQNACGGSPSTSSTPGRPRWKNRARRRGGSSRATAASAGAGLQPPRHAGPPHRVPVGGRQRRSLESRQPLCRASPARGAQGLDPGPRRGAPRTGMGARRAPIAPVTPKGSWRHAAAALPRTLRAPAHRRSDHAANRRSTPRRRQR